MKKIFSLALASSVASLAVVSCSVKEDVSNVFDEGFALPSVITIDPGNDPVTKHTYDFAGGRMRMHWEDGDAVFVSPASHPLYGSCYRIAPGGAESNTFVADHTVNIGSYYHVYYYPGERIHSDPDYIGFSYEGQVQRKSDPTGHLSGFQSMRKSYHFDATNYNYEMSSVSFSGGERSGCIRFVLSGTTFVNPKKIELQLINRGVAQNVFYSQNYLNSWFNDLSNNISASLPSPCSTLSMSLEGYGSESSITAYMMHTCADVPLPAGSYLRVIVSGDTKMYADVVIPTASAIKGGYYSTLSVDSGWHELAGDYTEYSWDGEVVTLQNPGSRLDLVIMGDGFIKEDFDNGTYDKVMRQVYSEFFSVEPYATFKNDFNVFYVKAPSPQRLEATNTGYNGATNSGNQTKFSVQFTPNSTGVSGNTALAREYAKKAFDTDANERIKDATVVVVANQECRAGTCHTSWYPSNGVDYGQASAVAFMALGRTQAERVQLIHHEVNGHGFGKLADEYAYTMQSFNPGWWTDLQNQHVLGLFRNVDKYVTSKFNASFGTSYALTNDSDVLWYDMMNTSNNYESVEALGFYEGAKTYEMGFCRPTQNSSKSIMNSNTGIFNAISRRQILYRYRRLKGEVNSNIFGTAQELDYFLQWDAQYFLPKLSSLMSAPSSAERDNYVEELLLPFAEPVIEEGVWNDGVFYKIEK